ncbi:MAG: hypothetical protein F6K10_05595 [Moorea sp. SIO2B7]|nr:hypothetical protein [Moorena sp. SIO2B7]
MDKSKLTVSDSVTFQDAIAFTESLLAQMEAEKLSEEESQTAIASLVKTSNGGRGFFVSYLTSDHTLADSPSTGVISALQSSPEIVTELLVKNLAMSAGMAVTHRRNHNEEMAKSSDRVRQRSANLIKQIQLDSVSEELSKLRESTITGEGEYQDFLQRWGYDSEQLQVIQQAVSEVISN